MRELSESARESFQKVRELLVGSEVKPLESIKQHFMSFKSQS